MTIKLDKQLTDLYDSGRLTCKKGEKIRIWQGWYRHDEFYLDGEKIGHIQVKRQSGRITSHTCDIDGGGVLGSDVKWLLRCHLDRKSNGKAYYK